MSHAAVKWARAQKLSHPSRGYVLIVLASYASPESTCWPSVGQLVQDTGLSERTVQACLAELVKVGLIERYNRHKPGHPQVAFGYKLGVENHPATVAERPATVDGTTPQPFPKEPQRLRGLSVEQPLEQPIEERASPRAAVADRDREFEEFYTTYPRKEGRGFALRAFKAARKKASMAELMAGLERYKRIPRDRQFTKHPASWLNGEHWKDEAPKPNGAGHPSKFRFAL